MRNLIFYIGVAVAIAAAYFALKDGLFEEQEGRKTRSPRSTVRGISQKGRKVGKGSGRAIDSVDFGGRR